MKKLTTMVIKVRIGNSYNGMIEFDCQNSIQKFFKSFEI